MHGLVVVALKGCCSVDGAVELLLHGWWEMDGKKMHRVAQGSTVLHYVVLQSLYS